jgi:hypothetical protein
LASACSGSYCRGRPRVRPEPSAQVDLTPYPALKSYHAALQTRPSIAKAFVEEMALYKAELARNKAA